MIRKETLTSAGSILLAFLASQHHQLHMLLLAAGLGGAGAGFLTMFPLIRRAMLLISLLMAGITVYRLLRRAQPVSMQVLGWLSAAASVGLVIWSVLQFGF